jgi:hypothetical protein
MGLLRVGAPIHSRRKPGAMAAPGVFFGGRRPAGRAAVPVHGGARGIRGVSWRAKCYCE